MDVAAFLGVCRVKGPERDRLLALCQNQRTPGCLQQHGSRLPKQLMTLINHEDKAVTIDDFQAIVVPGLLQTSKYARALISRSGNVPTNEVDERVAARLARQCLFSRASRARFTFYVHEFVLRTPVGGPAVMFDQLHHLLRMSTSSYVTLRVVPASLGVHAAMAGSFTFMEFAEFRPVTYLESTTSSLFLERPEETAAYRSILGALVETSLGEGESSGAGCHLGNRALRRSMRTMMTAPEPDAIVWCTSSYNGGSGGCVQFGWRTSSYSAEAVPTPAWRTFLTTLTH